MNVLIACEFSGVVRNEFAKRGHVAVSCDLLPSETELIGQSEHYQGDVFDIIDFGFDLMIAHPPCTRLCSSGARWFSKYEKEQKEAIEFVEKLWDANIPKIAIENPIGVLPRLSKLGKASQIIQPWMFGHGETKATCLWLKNLPLLKATNIVDGREARIHKLPPSKDRWKIRSRTFTGIGAAMAEQWG